MKLPSFRRKKKPESVAGEMSLVGHLAELRSRLIRSVSAIIVASIVVWTFFNPIFDVLAAPYCSFQSENNVSDIEALEDIETEQECKFLLREPLESFNVRLTMAGYGGLILALPVVLYQLGRFVMPGLYPHEQRLLLPFFAISVVLMILGMGTAYLMLERALAVLLDLGSDTFEPLFSPNGYLSFLVKMLFAFGIAAQLPIVLVFLQKIGIVTPETLAKNRRIAIVGVVILGAVITPTGDPFTLAVITVPMYLFYEIAILIGKRTRPLIDSTPITSSR